ncbi:riboflavin synthase [Metallumcola ferriviriculae]|uniref:Riboflavin synthase n=1 Tax=Metallumcola ferriviriculae TaxID=3039180 RepID=A0AAU0UR24_9FIRM|nr:riboflavin synthase [Desulfitibacteraceae bacterium MK1]
MFTGLVEELGTVKSIRHGPKSAVLEIEAAEVLEGVKLGDSIAVNGVCLTVTGFSEQKFYADVMAETLNRTSLKALRSRDQVNLERAMRLGDRLGGHLVSGHIDSTGLITGQEQVDIALVTRVEAPGEMLQFVIPKGSVALDGISLTVVDVDDKGFSVSLIPHTAKATTLGFKRVGDVVNIEVDMLAKYVARLLSWQKEGQDKRPAGVTAALLAESGFI